MEALKHPVASHRAWASALSGRAGDSEQWLFAGQWQGRDDSQRLSLVGPSVSSHSVFSEANSGSLEARPRTGTFTGVFRGHRRQAAGPPPSPLRAPHCRAAGPRAQPPPCVVPHPRPGPLGARGAVFRGCTPHHVTLTCVLQRDTEDTCAQCAACWGAEPCTSKPVSGAPLLMTHQEAGPRPGPRSATGDPRRLRVPTWSHVCVFDRTQDVFGLDDQWARFGGGHSSCEGLARCVATWGL